MSKTSSAVHTLRTYTKLTADIRRLALSDAATGTPECFEVCDALSRFDSVKMLGYDWSFGHKGQLLACPRFEDDNEGMSFAEFSDFYFPVEKQMELADSFAPAQQRRALGLLFKAN